jgi:hypothetical protein
MPERARRPEETPVQAPAAPQSLSAAIADPRDIDLPSVACIAVVSYLLAALVHEGLGHGLTAVLLGAKGLRLSTAALHVDTSSISETASRTVSIAGPLVGLAVGGLLALCHARMRSRNAGLRYCLWLTAYVCLFANSGYLMALSFVQFGDIDGFLAGVEHPFPWRLGLTVLGGVLYVTALFMAAHALDEFLGLVDRRARAARLLVTSYVVGCASLILSTLLGNEGVYLTLVSAAPATLGGTFGVLYTTVLVGGPKPQTDPKPLTPGRGLGWYAAGVVAVLIHVLVLGPGFPR